MIHINKNITFKNHLNERHRINGPAIIIGDNYRKWYLNGKRHREDGPAYIHGDYKEYWVNGIHIK